MKPSIRTSTDTELAFRPALSANKVGGKQIFQQKLALSDSIQQRNLSRLHDFVEI